MHIATAAASPAVHYRERLSPSLWTLLSAAVIAPMVALVFVPLDATVALTEGVPPGGAEIRITPGDRIAQLMFVPVARPVFALVDAFSQGSDRAGGFGSTGV